MTWILDGVLLLLVVVCFFTYSKRGFLSAVVGIIAVLAALLFAYWASGALAEPLYESLVRGRLIESVGEQLASSEAGGAVSAALGGIGALFGLTEDALAGASGMPADAFVDTVLAESAINIMRTLLFLLLYLVIAAILQGLARGLRRANDVPLLGLANRLGGGVIGIAIGLFYGFLFVSACALTILMTKDSLGWLNTTVVSESRLFSLAYPYNLFALLGR